MAGMADREWPEQPTVNRNAAPAEPDTFGDLLRERRLEAGLTQEALAERAGLSLRSIRGLERGESRPYRQTAQRLVAALGLTGAPRQVFEAAAQPPPRRRGVLRSRSDTVWEAPRAPGASGGGRHLR